MKIEPASLATFTQFRDGRRVLVEDDVNGVARDLAEISPQLELHVNEHGGFFMVIQRLPGDDEHLVLTAKECDQRIVERVRQIASDAYDFSGEVARLDDEADRRRDYEFAEKMGEIHERLAHAIRKDTGQRKPDYVRADRRNG